MKDLGTARRLTGVSADQTLVENAKIEVSRVEEQMRRLSRWLLRKRRANWLEEFEEGIRKNRTLTQCTDTHDVLRARASDRNTSCSDRFEHTLLLRSNGHRVLREKDQRGDWHCTHNRGKAFDKSTRNWRTLGESETTALHREEARADYARTVKLLRRAPARLSCPPWSIPGAFGCFLCGRPFLRRGKLRFDALGYKPLAGSPLLESRHAITACLEATRRCDAAPMVSSRSLGWATPKPGKVGFESCRLVHGMCDFLERVAPWTLPGGNVARVTVVLLRYPTCTTTRGRGGFASCPGCTLSSRGDLLRG